MSDKYDIFISHSTEDRKWVRRLVDALSQKSLDVWYDEAKISPGDPLFVERIEEGLRESTNIVFIVSPKTVRSTWLAAELGAALALSKPVIAVVSEDTPLQDIPGPMKARKFLRKGTPNDVAAKIAQGIVARPNGGDEGTPGQARPKGSSRTSRADENDDPLDVATKERPSTDR